MESEIICTLGTTTDSRSVLEEMINNGMTGVRLNTAYASIKEYEERIDAVRNIKEDVSVMLDIKGPQVRLGEFDMFTITKDTEFLVGFPDENGKSKVPIYFNKNFISDLSEDNKVLFENGTIETKIIDVYDTDIRLKVLNPGEGVIHKYMGVNVPGVYLNVDKLSEKDKEVIEWGMKKNVDQIALSFVRDANDVQNCYEYMMNIDEKKARSIELNLKIEDLQGISNIESIIQCVNLNQINASIMIGRGDLFVELVATELPYAQNKIIQAADKYRKPVIVGTGILESMQHNSSPSRAEICDIYNLLEKGVRRFMLSGETSYGKNPALVVKTLKESIRKYAIANRPVITG